MKTDEESSEGYILEVDLEYPEEKHDLHNYCPPAPEKLVAKDEWFSQYQIKLIKNLKSTGHNVRKLTPNLMDKERYVIHYKNLQLYVSLGMKVTKVHKVQFNQSAWMKPYIMKNTELRTRATSDFDEDVYKLLNNSVFGKTMENVRNRVNITLTRGPGEAKLKKYIAKPTFVKSEIFYDDLVRIQMHKTKVLLNKPIYVGMTILDLSKWLMYDFYCNHLKKEYDDKVRL